MNIPSLNLTEQYQGLSDEVGAAVLEVLASGGYVNGPRVDQFERDFASYVSTSTCVACNSGTDALYLSLRAFRIGAGDEVITSPFTFIATAEMISAVQATPVFVDIDPHTYNLDVTQIEAAITPRTKAIMPVHLFGQPADMTQVMAIAQAHHLVVIEDCAQAVGATWQGSRVGSIGHVGCFSFYPTKNLGACGDGGAVTTNDAAIATQIRILREHGSKTRYYHDEIGINSRLDVVQAVILSIKLRYLDGWNARRGAIAHRYQQLLQTLPGIILPQVINGGQSIWNQYTIRLPRPSTDTIEENYRDRIRQRLQQRGIGSMIYYPLPLHQQPVYASLGYRPGQLPVSEQLALEVLSLPMFPELSDEQQNQVVYALKDLNLNFLGVEQ